MTDVLHGGAPTATATAAPDGGDDVVVASARLMGTTAEVVLVAPGGVTPEAVLDRLRDLESRWSRFREDSELSRCNARSADELGSGRGTGTGSVVSPETADLVARMVWACELTGGLFDPTVIDALEAAGYDRDLEQVRDAGPRPLGPAPAGSGCHGVTVDHAIGLVHLPPGVRLDPGGCGKGLAADLAALEAVGSGAGGALVSVGGDLRAAGTPPPGGWPLEVDHLVGAPVRLSLTRGALATSSVLRRRWVAGGGEVHHVIDPRTGRPATGDVVSVSVLAAEAWLAEVLATALLVADGGPLGAAGVLLDTSAGALVTHADGSRRRLGALAHHLDPAPGGSLPVPPLVPGPGRTS